MGNNHIPDLVIAEFDFPKQELYRDDSSSSRNRTKIIKILKKHKIIESQTKIKEEFCFKIDCLSAMQNASNFLDDIQNFRFSKIRKIEMKYIDKWLETKYEKTCSFLSYSLCDFIQYLTLEARLTMSEMFDQDCLPSLFQKVIGQIYLKFFTLNQESLRKIIEYSSKCSQLVFRDCNIVFTDGKFALSTTIPFSITQIDFFGSLNQWSFSSSSMVLLINSICSSSLRKSLESIHIDSKQFPDKRIQAMLHSNGVDCKVIGKKKIDEAV